MRSCAEALEARQANKESKTRRGRRDIFSDVMAMTWGITKRQKISELSKSRFSSESLPANYCPTFGRDISRSSEGDYVE